MAKKKGGGRKKKAVAQKPKAKSVKTQSGGPRAMY